METKLSPFCLNEDIGMPRLTEVIWDRLNYARASLKLALSNDEFLKRVDDGWGDFNLIHESLAAIDHHLDEADLFYGKLRELLGGAAV